MPIKWRLAAGALLVAGLTFAGGVETTAVLMSLVLALLLILWLDWKLDRMSPGPPLWSASAHSNVTDPSQDILAIVEALKQPTILLDKRLAIRANNSAARELFPQLRLGEPLSPAVRNPELLRAAEEVLKLNSGRSVEIHNRFPDLHLLATLVPLRLEHAGLNGVAPNGNHYLILHISDLTEQTRLAQMRSDFIANASHELRTPLASLRGFIETLRGAARYDTEAQDRFLGIMDEQALRMTRILDDLLSLSRIEMRTHLLPDTIVDLDATIAAVVRGLEPIARDATISINIENEAVTARVRGDRHELEQVFRNLIHNAIKYGREGGKADVLIKRVQALGSRRERIAVSVADDGLGISEEHLPRLTERFYRVDTSASRQLGGTGLGLAIVKHIVMRHRGALDIASELGVGSTFTVTLDAAATKNEAFEPNRPDHQNKN
jgi:two-component system, OmpR family, phosphate regulon sensor histidine kinase PhoR